MACLMCTEQEMVHLFVVVSGGLVTIIKDISIRVIRVFIFY